ncbi:MAG TPA: glycosyltransferase family 2 protein [Candidatus Binatia bacterium]|nr:glycosyltransferase family 2 protein [Candidatus Binatia bacterium]
MISVIILTFNSEATIGATLAAACQLSDDIHVVDSGSTDNTARIARSFGAHLVTHPFLNYSAQRNWAIDALPLRYDWELHLDADERPTAELIAAIRELMLYGIPPEIQGYHIPRLTYFLGRPIRHGGMYPVWHTRLFRRRAGRCEERKYDQHFYVNGKTAKLPHPIIDDVRMSLFEWTARHNQWTEAEATQALRSDSEGVIRGRLRGNPVERKRALREVYEGSPRFARAVLLFLYRYIMRMGFLDGREGLVFFVLQTFWFRFLVDAKLLERELAARQEPRQSSHAVAAAPPTSHTPPEPSSTADKVRRIYR